MSALSDAATIHRYWFDILTHDDRFGGDMAIDVSIRSAFQATWRRVIDTEALDWRSGARDMLVAVIVVDQFSRNLLRGRAAQFDHDPLALELSLSAIHAGYAKQLEPDERAFLYMPLMYAEDRGVQRFSIRCFQEAGLEQYRPYACDHARAIERFGRFPSRNAVLGRASTPEEIAYLSERR